MPNNSLKQITAILLSVAICFIIIWLATEKRLQRAPALTLMTIDGQVIELDNLRGQPVLINFWATDCPSCLAELPDLIQLYNTYHSAGLQIIGINMYYDPPNHVVTLVKQQHIPYPVALDLQNRHSHAFGDVQFTPSHFLIDHNGYIIWQKTGRTNARELQTLLEPFFIARYPAQ